jgi:hypothetical protein
LEKWSIGVMEFWKVGIMNFTILHYSITPAFFTGGIE